MSEGYILVIDDDQQLLDLICVGLKKYGFPNVKGAKSAQAGMAMIKAAKPDLIVLDIMMPETNGIELCKQLRADNRYNSLLILFLSSLATTDHVVEGLEAGGDDYVTKPFELPELAARIRALRRRDILPAMTPAPAVEPYDPMLTVGDLSLDSDAYQITTPVKVAQLTATEHRLLRYMMERPGDVLSPALLLETVWGYPAGSGDADLVRAHIRKLRFKIEPHYPRKTYIRTVHGVGYRLVTKSGDSAEEPEDEPELTPAK